MDAGAYTQEHGLFVIVLVAVCRARHVMRADTYVCRFLHLIHCDTYGRSQITITGACVAIPRAHADQRV